MFHRRANSKDDGVVCVIVEEQSFAQPEIYEKETVKAADALGKSIELPRLPLTGKSIQGCTECGAT